ncbi:hypothetical protein KKC13_00890 [bacterium]|nr:hypothetical protein [bacterium]MBU1958950.1 hypothetical protein [bacterium]
MRWIIKISILLTLSYSKIIACSGEWEEMYVKDEYYNFLQASMIDVDEKNPLYQLSGSYYAHDERFDYFTQRKKEANIEAWKNYFKDAFSTKEIESIFYTKDAIAKSHKRYKESKEYPAFSRYISFLHSQNDYAQNKHEKTKKPFKDVISKGLSLLESEKDPFIKERYLYVMMRLYHHQGQYQKTLDLYVKYFHHMNKNSVVNEWIDALLAGSFQHLNLHLKANQLYAKIFKEHKTNAHLGYYDFKVHSDLAWETLLAEAPDNDTKALYHFLRAMQWKNEPLFEFESIAKIAPESVWFKRLNYMIMQDFQNQRYELMSKANKKDKYFKNSKKSYMLKKDRFLNILESIKNPSFFTLYSKLYLETLDYQGLQNNDLMKLYKLAKEEEKPYVQLLSYMHGLHQLSSNSLEDQEILYKQLKLLLPQLEKKKQKSILRYTALQLATLYPKNSLETHFNELFAKNKEIHRNQILKAVNFEKASNFKAYIEKESRSFLEKEIFMTNMKSLQRNDVAKILATLYMQDNNFNRARFYLRQTPRDNVYSPYNPFNATLSGNNRDKSRKSYNQRDFTETMLRLEDTLKKNPKSAIDHFLYANGLYNKSWFGNFPMSSVLYRNTSIYKDTPLPKTTNLRQVEDEYLLAFYYAKDNNFKAKIVYQLLKIEFNKALINKKNYGSEIWSMPTIGGWNNGTKKVIQLLKKSRDFSEAIRDYKAEYGHTKYGKKVIENCLTFRYF